MGRVVQPLAFQSTIRSAAIDDDVRVLRARPGSRDQCAMRLFSFVGRALVEACQFCSSAIYEFMACSSYKVCNRSQENAGFDQLLNHPVSFCSAACNRGHASFTLGSHPDVGEGASPQLA